MRIEIDSKQSNRVSSHRNRESLPPFLSSVTGSRGYATRSDNAATRFRWTSRPNPLEKRDYSRLIGTELWRNFEAALEGRAGADCRGSGFRPVASFLSLSLWHALLSTRALARKLNEALFDIYIYIYTFCKVAGHGSWRILRSAGVISLKDSRRFTDRCFLQKSRRLRV